MKHLIKIKAVLVIVLVLFTTACEDFLDVNNDPNSATVASMELVLPAGIGSAAYVSGGWYQILGGLWAQHWTQSTGAQQYRSFDSYDIQTTTLDDRQYGELYAGALNDLKYVKEQAAEKENWSYYLIATVMQGYVFQVLADLYENVPFEDALQGDEGLVTPEFNNSKDIYAGIITMIDDALGKDMDGENVTTPGAEDLIFQGNMTQWVRFANTLKLKIYLRQADANSSVASAGIQKLYADGAEFLMSDATMTAFADEQNKRNPVYETEFDRFGAVNIVASNTLMTYLDNNGDPRIDGIFNTPKTGGNHVGLDQGDFFNTGFTSAADVSQPNVSPFDAVYFMSAAESYFLQAEAVACGWGTGDAKALYEAGIDASFTKFGVSGASALYASGGVYEYPASGTQDDQLEAIIVQKWIALANSQSLEAWFDQNRTGYPDFFTESINTIWGPGQFPRRLLYPDSEYQTNKANVPELKRVYEKMWWHK